MPGTQPSFPSRGLLWPGLYQKDWFPEPGGDGVARTQSSLPILIRTHSTIQGFPLSPLDWVQDRIHFFVFLGILSEVNLHLTLLRHVRLYKMRAAIMSLWHCLPLLSNEREAVTAVIYSSMLGASTLCRDGENDLKFEVSSNFGYHYGVIGRVAVPCHVGLEIFDWLSVQRLDLVELDANGAPCCLQHSAAIDLVRIFVTGCSNAKVFITRCSVGFAV